MRKIITFIGTRAEPTTYLYKGNPYDGNLFQVALRQFMPFDEMLVFATEKAKNEVYYVIEALNDTRIRSIPIKTGENTEELWEIFTALVDNVNEGDRVIFDITHSLRITPFLTFLAVAYLRLTKNVAIDSVLYGAFVLGQKGAPAPVIELTEFVSLFDWMMATNRFTKSGNAVDLANELSKLNNPNLNPLAETIETIATGLHLLRPQETTLAAAQLSHQLVNVKSELPIPFALLADTLLNSYGNFGESDKTDSRSQLTYQLKMINWYHERGQYVHALSLAREWVISFLCWHFKLDALDKDNRNEMEFLIGGGKLKEKNSDVVLRLSPYLSEWENVPNNKRLQKLWVKGAGFDLADLRNDVLHSGFRKNAKLSSELLLAVKTTLAELNAIAKGYNFLT